MTDKISAAVSVLAKARPPGEAIAALPDDLAPSDMAEAWAMHQAAVALLGPVVGWKTGAPTPEAEPMLGEITADTIHQSPATVPAAALRLWAVEAEIAVTFGRDLPAKDGGYSADEVLAAVATWHAAIEVLDTAFADWKATSPLSKFADRQSHGLLILGPGSAERPSGPLGELPVKLRIDGEVAYDLRGGNSAGDPTRLLVSLVNRFASQQRCVKAGDVVTTGSTTPFHRVSAGQRVVAEFDGLAPAELTVGA
ncbi:2-keto-4-pentenoate hydratase [Hansschlegelia zhihuaiae]|uniref:Fumarylacetoacetase-like C-terminal domain-containing protein n=1 Tax=Hansschlegelia zhihuaiae TaxID=405005 RepID=A0A4Q0MLM5_9HYPH|nr:fumarylacetoacetate hydrolase family protein [Hansschlegelia zhihuaiae]RXF74443.1 hypothetical protein EK403_06430 [Hansschlegelia zhihuaiae]